MVSNTTILLIVIGIAVGIGIGYNAFASSPSSMGTQQQANMTAMMQNPDMMIQMMDVIMQDPDLMKQMMNNMMMQNPEAMQAMMSAMNQAAGNMSSPMKMGSTQQPFNPDSPITMPMIDGYYNGNKVFFIHTEVSDKKMADMMTMMINFPTLHVPQLRNVSDTDIGKIYVFTNGVPGSGPYGGGPFMFQIDVFDSIPGQTNYSNFRTPHLVTWNDNTTARILTSEEEILQAQANGELTIKNTSSVVVNVPIIAWTDNNGQNQITSTIDRPFESMPGVDGQLIHVDTDNYVLRLKLQQPAFDQQQSAMNMTMIE
jgi:hypothetical protein